MSPPDSHHDRTLKQLPLEALRPHERTIESNLRKITRQIRTDERLELPILVDADTTVILDGHHRWKALRRIGGKRITVMSVDYPRESGIELARGPNCPIEDLSRDSVIEKGLSDSVFPPKSTRHRVLFPYPTVNTPLSELTEQQ